MEIDLALYQQISFVSWLSPHSISFFFFVFYISKKVIFLLNHFRLQILPLILLLIWSWYIYFTSSILSLTISVSFKPSKLHFLLPLITRLCFCTSNLVCASQIYHVKEWKFQLWVVIYFYRDKIEKWKETTVALFEVFLCNMIWTNVSHSGCLL